MYSIIYADPPWQYTSKPVSPNREATNHYSTMALEEIKGLGVERIANKNSVLFLWATCPCLPEAFEVMEAWGFKYKTVGFTWAKLNKNQEVESLDRRFFMGMGSYTRGNVELCLVGVRGKGLKRLDFGVRQLVLAPRREHSRKPDEVRDRIVKLYGDLPRIELFAREKVVGWDAWGDEVEPDIQLI